MGRENNMLEGFNLSKKEMQSKFVNLMVSVFWCLAHIMNMRYEPAT